MTGRSGTDIITKPMARLKDNQMLALCRKLAGRAISEERWAAAERFLDRMIEEDPRCVEAWLLKGDLNRRFLGKPEVAARCYSRVLELLDDTPWAEEYKRAQAGMTKLKMVERPG